MLLDHTPFRHKLVLAAKYAVIWTGMGCVIYFLFVLFAFGLPGIAHPVSIVIEAYGLLEVLWYFTFSLWHRSRLQGMGMPMRQMTRAERKALIEKSFDTIPDARLFIRKWFSLAHLDQIHRSNMNDWMAWALWAKKYEDLSREEWAEIDGYVDLAEERAEYMFPPGRADGVPIRLNIDPVQMYHRTLLWYTLMGNLDYLAFIWLTLNGFRFYRLPLSKFFSVFPLRFLTLLSTKQSASTHFSYFYRPHKSKTHRPIMFIHGIGPGIGTYMSWLPSIPKEIGVIAVEIMNVSSRISPVGVDMATFSEEINRILKQHNIDDFVFVAHSYGTMLARPLLKNPAVAPKINSLILCDPVSILLHLPDVAYNITRRVASDTPQVEIDFAAAKDPMIAHTVCRRFHWPESILFREDFEGKRTTAVVAARDCVMNGPAVGAYMHYGGVNYNDADIEELKTTPDSWTGQADIELFYLHNRDHGQSLLIPWEQKRITRMVAAYADKSKDRPMFDEASMKDAF